MMGRRKPTEASLRAADRRQREDAAERLHLLVPGLATLELALEERRRGSTTGESRYVRRFVVDRAPAMFDLPCADRGCTDGGHDITRAVMDALRRRARHFEGEHVCDGNTVVGTCGRVLRFIGVATWHE